MDVNGLLNKFMGSDGSLSPAKGQSPLGGLAGGALAGGVMALLLGDKSVRKFAGKAATVGGMAVVGGLAYKAFQNWQESKASSNPGKTTVTQISEVPKSFLPDSNGGASLELTLMKAMIAAAKSDGHIDSTEQERIFKEVQTRNLSAEEKGMVFDLISRPIPIQELASSAKSLEHKSEVYLVSCFTCLGDSPQEKQYLASLANALELPPELVGHLDAQANSVKN